MLLKILLKDLTFKYMHMHIFTWSDEFHVPQVFLQSVQLTSEIQST